MINQTFLVAPRQLFGSESERRERRLSSSWRHEVSSCGGGLCEEGPDLVTPSQRPPVPVHPHPGPEPPRRAPALRSWTPTGPTRGTMCTQDRVVQYPESAR